MNNGTVEPVFVRGNRDTKTGTYPIKIRITRMIGKKAFIKYHMTGIYITPAQWDPVHKTVCKHLDAQKLNLEILRKKVEYATTIGNENEIMEGKKASFYWWYEQYLELYKGKIKDSGYQLLEIPLNKLKKFSPELKIKQFDLLFVRQFESHLLKEGLDPNSIYETFNIIGRAVRLMIGSGAMELHKNPLYLYKPKKVFREKRRLTFKQIMQLENCLLKGKRQIIEQDWFLISFYLGLRFSDRCCIRKTNFAEGRLKYETKKKKTLADIPVPKQVIPLLEKYDYKYPSPVPILSELTSTLDPDKKKDLLLKENIIDKAIKSAYSLAVKTLKPICEKAGVPYVTPHSCRHSVVDYGLEKGLSGGQLSALLVHKHSRTTDIYIKTLNPIASDEGSNKLWGT